MPQQELLLVSLSNLVCSHTVFLLNLLQMQISWSSFSSFNLQTCFLSQRRGFVVWLQWGLNFSERQFFQVDHMSAHLVIQSTASLLERVGVALGDKGTISLNSKGQIRLLSRTTNMLLSLDKVRKSCLQHVMKRCRCPLCAQGPPVPLPVASVGFEGQEEGT